MVTSPGRRDGLVERGSRVRPHVGRCAAVLMSQADRDGRVTEPDAQVCQGVRLLGGVQALVVDVDPQPVSKRGRNRGREVGVVTERSGQLLERIERSRRAVDDAGHLGVDIRLQSEVGVEIRLVVVVRRIPGLSIRGRDCRRVLRRQGRGSISTGLHPVSRRQCRVGDRRILGGNRRGLGCIDVVEVDHAGQGRARERADPPVRVRTGAADDVLDDDH